MAVPFFLTLNCKKAESDPIIIPMKKIFLPVFAFCTFFAAGCASSSSSGDSSINSSELDLTLSVYQSQEKFQKFTQGTYDSISLNEFSDGFSHARYIYPDEKPPYELYDSTQIAGIAENMLFLQNPDGGWAKNLDFQRKYTLEELCALKEKNKKILPVTYELKTQSNGSTMDNRNIFSEIRYLAQVYTQIPEKRYAECAERALTWILNAQEPKTGGFTGADVYAITFNDDVMSDVLSFLNEVAENTELYPFFSSEMRTKAKNAYEHGIECILKCQITVTLSDGTKLLTAWCQQHSYENYAPIWAREFEPPSICSSESKKVVELLMKIKNPSREVKNAVIAACEFFDRDDIRIHDKKLVKISREGSVLNGRYSDYEQRLEDVSGAKDLWARFYALDSSFDVETGARKPIQGTYPTVLSPIWCDRGCKYVEDFNDLSLERRNGYGYTTSSMEKLVSTEYPKWLSIN